MEHSATAPTATASPDLAAAPPPGTQETAPVEPGSVKALLGTVNLLLEEASAALRGRMELFSLELRRTGLSLGQMVALALLAAVLLNAAWLTLMAGVYLTLVSLGLHWSLAILGVLLINVGGAFAALMRARGLSSDLGFPATKRRLRFGPHRSEDEPLVPPSDRQELPDGNP